MVRSRSRSPRWKHRSISPTYGRSQEYPVERPLYQSYSGELKEFGQNSGRPLQWKSQREKWAETAGVESRSADAQYGAIHRKVFEYGYPSPNPRRMGSEHTSPTGRDLYLQEKEGNRSYPPPSRYLEDNPYHDHDERPCDSNEWHEHRKSSHNERHHDHDQWHNDFDQRRYHQNVEIPTHVRLYNEKPKSFGGDPQMDSCAQSLPTAAGCTESWHNLENFRNPSFREERRSGSHSPGRRAKEFLDRSPYQRRYPDEDEVKGYRETSGRGWVSAKHEVIEHEKDLKWRGEKFPQNRKSYPTASYDDSEGSHVKEIPRDRYNDGSHCEEFVQVKSGFAHSPRYPEMHTSSEHRKIFSSGREPAYSSKGKEFTSSSSSNKEVSRFHSSSRKSGTDVNRREGRHSVSGKYSVSEHFSSRLQHGCKKEVSSRSQPSVTRDCSETGKELRKRSRSSEEHRGSTHKRSSHQSSDMEKSRHGTKSERNRTTESLTIRIDMKKTVKKCRPTSSHASERLMSRDLVSVGKKRDEFHHVFEHMGSSFEANPNISSGEFAQEIITLVHQIKEDHFKSSDLTLHDRFSKLQNAQSPGRKEENARGPEIHRRIDMSLEDLHNRERKPVARKTSTWVAVNPDDLRHDIERRRKERLQDKYGETYQTLEPMFLSRRSERSEKSHLLNRVKTDRTPRLKEPSVRLTKYRESLHRESSVATKRKIRETSEERSRSLQRPLKHFTKEYPSSGRKRGLTFETKYRRIYGVGFGRTNQRIFTKHFREGLSRKRRDERELPSSTTDK
ncbi:BCLAF1 and THRAP3 family member 3-like isoform X1 [Chiloscyllium plagiosum]|uniref:BCLAF1 and THRAP3 family member 3-like isoform X1 n=1 Tax=Chiloscyllium plagiosum TaxID=36176 RepID=UPI001CB7F035|nr:BCLAF1 and THRAP3 family member 3-like isoform X1 [Chiloscyllium plagiosum]XP_043556163.1 BCLAF1 and THRAP3 family member 3-like isoform X1 [Chiloscyllium plagiosum]